MCWFSDSSVVVHVRVYSTKLLAQNIAIFSMRDDVVTVQMIITTALLFQLEGASFVHSLHEDFLKNIM